MSRASSPSASPFSSSSRSPKAISNNLVAGLILCHESRGCCGVCLRTSVILGSVGSAAYTSFALRYCIRSIHVRFWLGDVVVVCLALYLAALLPAMLMLAYKICISAHRRSMKDHHKSMMGRGSNQVLQDFSLRLSVKTLRFVFMLITLLATVAAVLGYIVVTSGMEVSAALLMDCGKGETDAALENMDKKLRDFASSSQCSEKVALDQCRGFAKAFPPPSPWVAYTEVLENELACGGWCRPQPSLFHPSSKNPEACSVRLGHLIWNVGISTGVPTMAGASLLAFLGFVLYGYDGL
mmetsp:Transcript_37610/g.86872  ORF Transcript_37610/g.86872 Transcript_37610/m.86872 type:complete len:296 (+) Transcript_37610:122-1009(+)